ncbi:MAG: pyridoxal phosphate-dependent aminotransferase [Oscillospiraceae bacterium]|jgi:cystathionine beta-lyase|nr:pyridoxal phosphate-dependent aminotransferase [Oscillospiraceae bacterium]
MNYNFDEIVDRRNTDALKYDFAAKRGRPDGLLPLWVADMDFRTPQCVIDALVEKSRHGIFGYTESREDFDRVLEDWFLSRFQWKMQSEWNIQTVGVVFSICSAIRVLSEPGDGVLIQQPVYYPFPEAIAENGRRVVVNRLVYENGTYKIDFDDFEQKIREEGVKIFILCSPHNPVGRVWTREELERMGGICMRYDVNVISDEIHADIVMPGHKHLVFAGLKPEFENITVTCTAPSKSFNLPGLQLANTFVANPEMRAAIRKDVNRVGYSQINVMGLVACRAAYAHGAQWLDALNAYLAENLAFVRDFLWRELPEIKLVEPQGTYLLWLDCSALGLSQTQLNTLIVNKARLWLDSGRMFGEGGEGFQRVNMACPRPLLEQALSQLRDALRESIL